MIVITPTTDIHYLEYSKETKVIQNKILTLSKGTSLITNANCEALGLFEKEGLNEVLVSDTLQGLQSQIDSLGLTYTVEVMSEMFPHPPELNLNIRVDISDTGIRLMTKSPYKPLIDLALLAVNEDNATGVTIWLSRLENETMSEEDVERILNQFGGVVTRKPIE